MYNCKIVIITFLFSLVRVIFSIKDGFEAKRLEQVTLSTVKFAHKLDPETFR